MEADSSWATTLHTNTQNDHTTSIDTPPPTSLTSILFNVSLFRPTSYNLFELPIAAAMTDLPPSRNTEIGFSFTKPPAQPPQPPVPEARIIAIASRMRLLDKSSRNTTDDLNTNVEKVLQRQIDETQQTLEELSRVHGFPAIKNPNTLENVVPFEIFVDGLKVEEGFGRFAERMRGFRGWGDDKDCVLWVSLL